MASVVYNKFKQSSADGVIDLGDDDIYAALVMLNTTCDTENDGMENVDDFTTLDEMDGANYARKPLGGTVVNLDDANDRAEFDADNVTWSALGAGTRTVQGVLLYVDADDDGAIGGADDAANKVIAFIEFPSAVTADGSDLTVAWNAEGILQLT
tara:strand:+ start:15834 stop:16295 length:462 start_codon:yes stop_codon:yes gene_type:complete